MNTSERVASTGDDPSDFQGTLGMVMMDWYYFEFEISDMTKLDE